MEILLANNCGFSELVAARGQAAAPVSKFPDTGSQHSPGEMLKVSAQCQGWSLLLVPNVSVSVVQRCCPACAGSPRATWPAE